MTAAAATWRTTANASSVTSTADVGRPSDLLCRQGRVRGDGIVGPGAQGRRDVAGHGGRPAGVSPMSLRLYASSVRHTRLHPGHRRRQLVRGSLVDSLELGRHGRLSRSTVHSARSTTLSSTGDSSRAVLRCCRRSIRNYRFSCPFL